MSPGAGIGPQEVSMRPLSARLRSMLSTLAPVVSLAIVIAGATGRRWFS
jgi:hypothetical protein